MTKSEDREYPHIEMSNDKKVRIADWLKKNNPKLEEVLNQKGAVLFRGFADMSITQFDEFSSSIHPRTISNAEESSPRSLLSGDTFTSTDYPAEGTIFPHNENSYKSCFPRKLFLYCNTPSEVGGETPISDTREVLKSLDQGIIKKFQDKDWMIVRNYGNGPGLSWEKAFGTTSKEAVEQYCRSQCIDYEWKDGSVLCTRQSQKAICVHPVTKEQCWFNHATFFHISTLENGMGDILLSVFGKNDLPTNTYYGDGSDIESSILDELRLAYLENQRSFTWQKGDTLILDNILMAHSRNPYQGKRSIWFSQRDPVDRADCI